MYHKNSLNCYRFVETAMFLLLFVIRQISEVYKTLFCVYIVKVSYWTVQHFVMKNFVTAKVFIVPSGNERDS